MDFSKFDDSCTELQARLAGARGWYASIAKETGVSVYTLRRWAKNEQYDPPLSVARLVAWWFAVYGALV